MQHDIDRSLEPVTDLARLWRLLLDGELFVRETVCTEGRCFAMLEHASGGQPARPRGIALLERVFQGESQKFLAYEHGVSVATIAAHSANALCAMVTRHRVSRAPIIVVMAAAAALGAPLGRARLEQVADDRSFSVSVEVPGRSLKDRLSPGEWDVARLSIEGESHSGIARVRGRSPRTVANQLASAFHKLGVSGRASLRDKAIREYAAEQLRASHIDCAQPTLPPIAVTPHFTWVEPELLAYG